MSAAHVAAVHGAAPVVLRAKVVLPLLFASPVNGADTFAAWQADDVAVGVPAKVQLPIGTLEEVEGLPLRPSPSEAVTRTVYVEPHTRLLAVAVKTPAPRVIGTAIPYAPPSFESAYVAELDELASPVKAALIESDGVAPVVCEAVTTPRAVLLTAQAATVTGEAVTAGLPVTPSASVKVAW
ncbi:MAG: hypothetical protein WCC48_05620 [Anaeromyxobacteraceae bacterium]